MESKSVVSFANRGAREVSWGRGFSDKESKDTEVESCEKTVLESKNRQKAAAFMDFIVENIVNSKHCKRYNIKNTDFSTKCTDFGTKCSS
jgi:hypothetical protein